jgi:hypothetical protein
VPCRNRQVEFLGADCLWRSSTFEAWPIRQFGPCDEPATSGPMQAELDLLIRAALLANLPRSGSFWPEQKRQVAEVG